MFAAVNSSTVVGIEGYIVEVEVDVSFGMPSFDIVGLPDTAVRESKDRVRSAIRNSNLEFPGNRITVNLAPADIRKEGPLFDLPIAIGILAATGQISLALVEKSLIVGELSLDGSVRAISGALPLTLAAKENDFANLFLPLENASEAALVRGLNVFPLQHLREFVDFDHQEVSLLPFKSPDNLFDIDLSNQLDFADVKGQEHAKRALEVAAAGGHNILLIGPPGSGKTLLARSVPSILPSMTFEEALEVTKVHSVSGHTVESKGLITLRPFRAPHHSISFAGLIGGGRYPKPGEVSLAHNGVLFLDELPEFSKHTLEHLRQPLEDGLVTIARVQGHCTYPSRFMLISAMNPCPCGYYGDSNKECICSPYQVQRYNAKISGPLLDRIDIQIEVPSVSYDELTSTAQAESSVEIRERVELARGHQRERFADVPIYCNGAMNRRLIKRYCKCNKRAEAVLATAFRKMKLTARAYDRILKVARTIADLDNSYTIKVNHIAEAIQYRSLDNTNI